MANDIRPVARKQSRPRPRLFLAITQDNPYARLGVSPTATNEEINAIIDQRRSEANKKLKAQTSRIANDPHEQLIRELDQIGELIGDDRVRAAYDAAHPQNVLLTVQPGTTDQRMRRHARAGLISEWLLDLAGVDALLPTPRCRRFWAPGGIDPETLAALGAFAPGTGPVPPPAAVTEEAELSVADMDRVNQGN